MHSQALLDHNEPEDQLDLFGLAAPSAAVHRGRICPWCGGKRFATLPGAVRTLPACSASPADGIADG